MTVATIKAHEGMIVVAGHAGYAPQGYDIVCAGISSLVWAFIRTNGENVIQTENEAFISLRMKRINETFIMLIEGLKNIAEAYPDYFRVVID